jgi:hypothetical protein
LPAAPALPGVVEPASTMTIELPVPPVVMEREPDDAPVPEPLDVELPFVPAVSLDVAPPDPPLNTPSGLALELSLAQAPVMSANKTIHVLRSRMKPPHFVSDIALP